VDILKIRQNLADLWPTVEMYDQHLGLGAGVPSRIAKDLFGPNITWPGLRTALRESFLYRCTVGDGIANIIYLCCFFFFFVYKHSVK